MFGCDWERYAADEEKEALMQQLKNMAIAPYDKEKFLASITSETKRVKFSVLHENQDKVDELQEQFAKERKALELKYRSLCGMPCRMPWFKRARNNLGKFPLSFQAPNEQ